MDLREATNYFSDTGRRGGYRISDFLEVMEVILKNQISATKGGREGEVGTNIFGLYHIGHIGQESGKSAWRSLSFYFDHKYT